MRNVLYNSMRKVIPRLQLLSCLRYGPWRLGKWYLSNLCGEHGLCVNTNLQRKTIAVVPLLYDEEKLRKIVKQVAGADALTTTMIQKMRQQMSFLKMTSNKRCSDASDTSYTLEVWK